VLCRGVWGTESPHESPRAALNRLLHNSCNGNYKELIDKSYQTLFVPVSRGGKIELTECGKWSKRGRCVNGHQFAKVLYCGREWCPRCGEMGSAVHLQRFARWLPKAQQIRVMGYWDITLPLVARAQFRDKQSLRKARRAVVRWLKRHGFGRGLARWHWFGNPPADGTAPKWHPHLNLLVDAGWVSKEKLAACKRGFARAMKLPEVQAHYAYDDIVSKKIHWLKYVSRATFRSAEWDKELLSVLERFNTTMSWGCWKDAPAWGMPEKRDQDEMDARRSLAARICPTCGEEIVYDKDATPTAYLVVLGFTEFLPGWLGFDKGS